MPGAASDPTPARMIFCALAVLLFATGVWGFIAWRSAPPPPPAVEMPGATLR